MQSIKILLTALFVCSIASCDQSTKGQSDTELKNILNVLDVHICNINLNDPTMVSIVTEFDDQASVVFTPSLFEDDFIVAVQTDKDSGRIRIALGDSSQAISSNLTNFEHANRAWIYYHTPMKDAQGRYTIMETVSNDLPNAKIVAITKNP